MKKCLKFLTCREYVAIHKPEAICAEVDGGVSKCPSDYGLHEKCGRDCYDCYDEYARKQNNNKYIAIIIIHRHYNKGVI